MKNSTDIWFCAFLLLKEKKIEKFDVISRGKVRCYFMLSDDEWKNLKLEFNHSDHIKFKSLVEQIKDLSF